MLPLGALRAICNFVLLYYTSHPLHRCHIYCVYKYFMTTFWHVKCQCSKNLQCVLQCYFATENKLLLQRTHCSISTWGESGSNDIHAVDSEEQRKTVIKGPKWKQVSACLDSLNTRWSKQWTHQKFANLLFINLTRWWLAEYEQLPSNTDFRHICLQVKYRPPTDPKSPTDWVQQSITLTHALIQLPWESMSNCAPVVVIISIVIVLLVNTVHV